MSATPSTLPSPLSLEDSKTLDLLGLVIADSGIGQLCEAIFWAIYLVLFVFALKIQIRRGIRGVAAILMLTVTVFLFASSTTLWVMSFTSFFCRINIFFRGPADEALDDRKADGNDCIFRFGLAMEALFLVNMIVGDAVVIWRAWVIWQGARLQKLVFIPMIMLLTSAIFTIIAMDCLAADSFAVSSAIPDGSKTCQWGEPIAWALSLLTNFTSTGLIAVKAWQHRRFLSSSLGSRRTGTRSEKVLVLLVESGFVYCLFWTSQIILFFDDIGFRSKPSVIKMYMVLSAMGDQISGLYPTAVIVLVSMQHSMALNESKLFSAPTQFSGRTAAASAEHEMSTVQFAPTSDRKAELHTTITSESYFSRESV